MGNSHAHKSHKHKRHTDETNNVEPESNSSSPVNTSSVSASILKLFQKMELTADDDNTHPGELSRETFEKAFQGPLHKFGKLMFRHMKNGNITSDRITREEFVQSGTAIVTMVNVDAQRKYYFRLFSCGKDYLTKEDALQMVHVSYMLTVSVSKITYTSDDRDLQLFQGMVTSMFGIDDRINCEKLDKWLQTHCPNMFSGVHSWVCTVLGGSNLPSEMEANTRPVPQLENFICGHHVMCLGMAWALSALLPLVYTKAPVPPPPPSQTVTMIGSGSSPRSSFFSLQNVLASLHRLPKVQCWHLLYSSDRDGLSKNRFCHHIMSYHSPNLVFFCFEGGNQYCLALDQGFSEGTSKFGGKDCYLIQLLPVYRVIQSGPRLVMFNTVSRNIPRGLHVGMDNKALVLQVPEGFDVINHYGVPCQLHRIEVWGCGGDEAKQAQVSQKQWEAKDIEREKMRKLRLEGDWRENPDLQLLEWGGVKTGSSYAANR